MRVLVKLSQEELEKLGEIMGNEIEEAEDAAYAIHIVLFDGKKYETTGCHNKGTRAILLPEKKSKSVEKLTIYKYAGGYYPSKFA